MDGMQPSAPLPVAYAIFTEENGVLLAAKMERNTPAPQFVRLTASSEVIDANGAALLDRRHVTPGAIVQVYGISGRTEQWTMLPPSFPNGLPPKAETIIEEIQRCELRRPAGTDSETLILVNQKRPMTIRFDCPITRKTRTVRLDLIEGGLSEGIEKGSLLEARIRTWPNGYFATDDLRMVFPSEWAGSVPVGVKLLTVPSTKVCAVRPAKIEVERAARLFAPDGLKEGEEEKADSIIRLAIASVEAKERQKEQELTIRRPVRIHRSIESPEVELRFDYPKKKHTPNGAIARMLKRNSRVLMRPDIDSPASPMIATIHEMLDFYDRFEVRARVTKAIFNAQLNWMDLKFDGEWVIQPPRSIVVTNKTHDHLKKNLIARLLKEEGDIPQAEAVKIMMGKRDENGNSPLLLEVTAEDQQHPQQQLTPHQSRAVRAITSDEWPVIVVQAAAGAGKTAVGSSALAQLSATKQKGEGVTAAASSMNIAVEHLVEATLLKHPQAKIIVIQSATFLASAAAADPYHRFRLPILIDRLAAGTLVSLPLNEKQLMVAQKAAAAVQRRHFDIQGVKWSCLTDVETDEEKDAIDRGLRLLIELYEPELILGTTAILMEKAEVLADHVQRILIDEAGAVPRMSVLALLLAWPHVESVSLMGDEKQLGTHLPDASDERIAKIAFKSALEAALENPSAARIFLPQTFRQHPSLTSVVSALSYNNELQPAADPNERALVLATFPTIGKAPIALVDVKGGEWRTTAQSYENIEQQKAAIELAQLIQRAGLTDVQIIAVYAAAVSSMQQEMKRMNVEGISVKSIDSAQGSEMDVAIIVTVRNARQNRTTEDETNAYFEDNLARLTVSITRPKHGVVVVGDMQWLKTLPNWSRAITLMTEQNPAALRSLDGASEVFAAQPTGGPLMRALGLLSTGNDEEAMEYDPANPSI